MPARGLRGAATAVLLAACSLTACGDGAAVDGRGPTRVVAGPLMFQSGSGKTVSYGVVFRLNRDPLNPKPGAENRSYDRGTGTMAGYDLAAESGIHKSGRAPNCFDAYYLAPVDRTVVARVDRSPAAGVKIALTPRGSGGRTFTFRRKILRVGSMELGDDAARGALAKIGC